MSIKPNHFTNRFMISIIIGLIVLLFPWFLHGLQWPDIIATQLGHCPKQNCDFLNHYLPQAQKIHQGDLELQEGWFYPPTLAIGIETLLVFPTHWISSIWTGFNLIILCWLIRISYQQLRSKHTKMTSLLWAASLCTTSMPVLSSIKWGQISLFIVAICWWDLHKQQRHKFKTSGVGIAIAGSLKGFPMVYLLLPLWRRNPITFVRSIATFVVLGLFFPIIRIGIDQTLVHYQNMLAAGQAIQQHAPLWGGQALGPSMVRWFQNGDHMMDASPPRILAIPDILYPWLVGSVLIFISVLVLRKLSHHPAPLVLLFCWLGLLFAPGWQHYFCFLPLCMIALWDKTDIRGKSILIVAGLLERIPIFGLGWLSHIYYNASAWGTTTIATLLVLSVALFCVSCSSTKEDVQ